METADHRIFGTRLFDRPIHGGADRRARTLAGGEESGEGLIKQGGVAETLFSPLQRPKR